MTAQQQLIAGLLQTNAGKARTKAAAKSATEELHAYLDRLKERRRYDRPSPFSRFVEKLENAKRTRGANNH